MIARLLEGVSPMQAQQALSGTLAGVVKQTIGDVDPKEWKPLLDFLPARGIGGSNEEYRTFVKMLMGLVLLIAYTSVAMMVQAQTLRATRVQPAHGGGRQAGNHFPAVVMREPVAGGCGRAVGMAVSDLGYAAPGAVLGDRDRSQSRCHAFVFTLTISVLAALTFSQ